MHEHFTNTHTHTQTHTHTYTHTHIHTHTQSKKAKPPAAMWNIAIATQWTSTGMPVNNPGASHSLMHIYTHTHTHTHTYITPTTYILYNN